jgi:hypothetical protein
VEHYSDEKESGALAGNDGLMGRPDHGTIIIVCSFSFLCGPLSHLTEGRKGIFAKPME